MTGARIGVRRCQRDAAPRSRTHQRHPEMRPIGGSLATTGHRAEARCVRPDLQPVRRGQYRLQRRAVGRGRPVHRQHPFGVVDGVAYRPEGRPAPRCPRASAPLRARCPTACSRCAEPMAPADSTMRSAVETRPGRPDTVDADRACRRRTGSGHPGFGQQGQVRPIQAGPRKAPPGPTRVPPSMFSGTAPTPGDRAGQRPLRSAIHANPDRRAASTKAACGRRIR